jgi:thiol-disulfide isomerase/thioredoxin
MLNKLLITCLFLTSILSTNIVNAVNNGQVAPKLSVPMLNGIGELNLENYVGKVIYVDFWASWCVACLQSFPLLNEMRNELKSQGFEIIAINLDKESNDAKKFLEKYPVDFPIGYDKDGFMPKKYEIKGMPFSYIIDKKGIVRYQKLGFRPSNIDNVRQQILTLLQEG